MTVTEFCHHLVRTEPADAGRCGDWTQYTRTGHFCQNPAAVRLIMRWNGVGPEVAFYRCPAHAGDLAGQEADVPGGRED